MIDWKLDTKSAAFTKRVIENIRCGFYNCNSKLPSERKLGEDYQLSRNTIREGLRELFEAGILERRGRGAYVRSDALKQIESGIYRSPYHVIVVISFKMYDNPIYRTIFETARNALGTNTKFEIIFTSEYPDSILPRITPKCMVWAFGDALPEKLLRSVSEITPKLILVNRHNKFFNFIEPDNFAAGQMMAKYLYECGHRKVGASILHPEIRTEFSDRFNGAMDFAHQHDMDIILADPKISADNQLEVERFFLNTYYEQEHATAIMCFQDISALIIYELARNRNIRIPDDLSVIGFDDKNYSGLVHPALSTARYPSEAIGLKLAETARECFESGQLHLQCEVQPALQRRESVAIIAPNKE